MVKRCICEFSPNNKLLAIIDNDGKLLIWDSETNSMKQNVLLNLDAKASCTALTWIDAEFKKQTKSPQKNVHKNDTTSALSIAFGTSKGNVELFSVARGKLQVRFKEKGHTGHINHIIYHPPDEIFTCGVDAKIIQWSLTDFTKISVFDVGTNIPYTLAKINLINNLVVAGKHIEIHNLNSGDTPKRLTGHTTNVTSLKVISPFIISASQDERFISIWKLPKLKYGSKVPVASFILDDGAIHIDCKMNNNNKINSLILIAVIKTGIVQYFSTEINNITKQNTFKSNINLQIMSNSTKELVKESGNIPIIMANLDIIDKDKKFLIIAYGEKHYLTFEKILLDLGQANQILVRKDPRRISEKDKLKENNFGEMKPIVNPKNVEYGSSFSKSKKSYMPNEIPMVTRLENLTVSSYKQNAPPATHMVQLLIQGLQSSDSTILSTAIGTKDEKNIQMTIQLLPIEYIDKLIGYLTKLMHKKSSHVATGVRWIRLLMQTHSSQLMALGKENLDTKFGPCIGLMEQRIDNLAPIAGVRGRLDLLINQIKSKDISNETFSKENLLVYQDEDDEASINGSVSSHDDFDDNEENDNKENDNEENGTRMYDEDLDDVDVDEEEDDDNEEDDDDDDSLNIKEGINGDGHEDMDVSSEDTDY